MCVIYIFISAWLGCRYDVQDYQRIEKDLNKRLDLFKVDEEVRCDETYIFPPQQLLLKGRVSQFKALKGIFKKDAKSETMQMDFSPEKLTFGGMLNKKFGYDIAVQELD